MKLSATHRARALTATAPTQMGLDDGQEDSQDGAEGLRFALQIPAQRLRHREHPLTHRQRRDDVIDQVRGGLRHAPGVAGRTQPAALARKRNEKTMPTVRAAGVRETIGVDVDRAVRAPIGANHGGGIVKPGTALQPTVGAIGKRCCRKLRVGRRRNGGRCSRPGLLGDNERSLSLSPCCRGRPRGRDVAGVGLVGRPGHGVRPHVHH
jgi:hypothetical protein